MRSMVEGYRRLRIVLLPPCGRRGWHPSVALARATSPRRGGAEDVAGTCLHDPPSAGAAENGFDA
jgi:hypothetical protein